MRLRSGKGTLYCSFCRKSQDEVNKLISTPEGHSPAYICDECVAVCNSILEDDSCRASGTKHRYSTGEGPGKESWFDRVKSWWKCGIIDEAVLGHNQ